MSDQPLGSAPTGPPALTFTAFVLSLASTAAIHFGDLPDPATGQRFEPNLEGAAQMIEILALLDQKTRGNLTAEERQILRQVRQMHLVQFRLGFGGVPLERLRDDAELAVGILAHEPVAFEQAFDQRKAGCAMHVEVTHARRDHALVFRAECAIFAGMRVEWRDDFYEKELT